ncbi:DUF5110 domain-containing protein, partial [Acinetobacter baumannii]
MTRDPFTLLVALNADRHAFGTLYLDDGATHDYQLGAYSYRNFTFSNKRLTASEFLGHFGTRNSSKAMCNAM